MSICSAFIIFKAAIFEPDESEQMFLTFGLVKRIYMSFRYLGSIFSKNSTAVIVMADVEGFGFYYGVLFQLSTPLVYGTPLSKHMSVMPCL